MPVAISKKTLKNLLWRLHSIPRRTTIEEYGRLQNYILTIGRGLEKGYPDAPNLSELHRDLLNLCRTLHDRAYRQVLAASDYNAALQKCEPARRQLDDFVDYLLKTSDDVDIKFHAAGLGADHGIKYSGANVIPLLEGLVEQYKDTPDAARAYGDAAFVSKQIRLDDLRARYVRILKENYIDNRDALAYLREAGEYSDIGRPFAATLTTLDGQTLTLPRDLAGKAVVVVFWVTWPDSDRPHELLCLKGLLALKKFYSAYKGKNVEIVGVSNDPKEDVEKFVKEHDLDWTQTLDPDHLLYNYYAAGNYHVTMFTIFVLDKNGRIYSMPPLDIYSEDTYDKVASLVDEVLQGCVATKPMDE